MARQSILLLLVSMISSSLATYSLKDDYSGDAFFQQMDFFTESDPTDGLVSFQSMESANSTGLAGFIAADNQTSKAVYMAVDSTTIAPEGRGSVRVQSQETYNHGLFIIDIAHMPGGICGTWPAFWLVGADWPGNGEIDIVEGVNDQASNIMTLHSAAGPVINSNVDFAGQITTTNCDVNAPDQSKNAGCSITDTSDLTFGSGFNTAGGGVYATEWTSTAIKIWFFPRGQIPDDIASSTPNPDSWPTPRSVFQGDFNMDDHFKNQQIIFDTTFCGQWAGQTWSSVGSCSQLAPTCEEYVTNNPSAFADAYWAVNTLQVFQDDSIPDTSSADDGTAEKRDAPIVTPISGSRRGRRGGAVLAR